jgi:hypothetical protein
MCGLCQETAFRIEDGAGVVPTLFYVGGVGGALKGCAHLLRDRFKEVPPYFHLDGVKLHKVV